jgi:hypothetical protein
VGGEDDDEGTAVADDIASAGVADEADARGVEEAAAVDEGATTAAGTAVDEDSLPAVTPDAEGREDTAA